MIDREQLKCYPELVALIEQEHTLEQVERITVVQDVGVAKIAVVFIDGTAKVIDGPINYAPKEENK